jgi:glycosyltransferase involved in cell wall biosynthesis
MLAVQLFIATHNRPELVVKTIGSALNQKFDSFEVIVSDNSTNDETGEIIKQFEDNRLIYKRRMPPVSSNEHFNAILRDVTSEFFMIFHDDDIMYENMISELYKNLFPVNEFVAVGANARIVSYSYVPKRLMLKRIFRDLTIRNRDQMAHRYLIKRGIVPFSSYMYRSVIAKKLKFNLDDGGKHCDVAFMMDVASMGNVLMLGKPLMDYFIRPGQDSKTNDFLNRISLINFITRTSVYKKDSYLIKRFRIVNLYYELLQDINAGTRISRHRRFLILKLIFKVSPHDFFPRIIFQLIGKK